MRGKKTSKIIVDKIDRLRKECSPSEVVKRLDGRLPKRTIYRILKRLRNRDEEKAREAERQICESKQQEIQQRLEANPIPKVERFKRTSQFPPNLRAVRSY